MKEKELTPKPDRVCEECGLIHQNGIDRHGRCYESGHHP